MEPDLFSDDRGDVLRLPPEPQRLKDARRFVSDALARWGAFPPDDAALMTSELVSNAIIHAGGEIAVRVRRSGNCAVIEVHDHSPERPQPQPLDPRRPGGNGMRIVEALARSWGVTEIHDDGKVVWFEISLPT